jgi:Na+/proline symporter
MVLAAGIAAAVVLTGADFVTIVLTSYAIRTAILVPLILALFWRRVTGLGFVLGTVGGIAIGMPVRSYAGELAGSLTILVVSAVIPVALGLRNRRLYDFERLRAVRDATSLAPAAARAPSSPVAPVLPEASVSAQVPSSL